MSASVHFFAKILIRDRRLQGSALHRFHRKAGPTSDA
jgi:hypothetical protein